MPYAAIDDSVSLYYHLKGEGLPIVFIHPFVMNHAVFKHQEKLAEKYKVIFYDLAGHGLSSEGKVSLSIDLLAEDLRKLLDKIGIEKVVLCAYSHGGTIAQEFALKYPERTIALIMSGGYSELNNFSPKFFIKSVMALAKFRQMTLAAKLQAKLNKHFPEDEREIFEYGRKSDARRSYEYCKAGLHYKSTAFLHRLNMPVLLVYGTLEKPMHHYRIPFLQKAPCVEVVFIEGGTHQLPPISFTQFNAAVERFLHPINKQYKLERHSSL